MNSVRIRGQISHPKARPNEIYITDRMHNSVIIDEISKLFYRHDSVIISSAGAENYHAMKCALQFKKSFSDEIIISISTHTITTHDFYMPTKPNETPENKTRNLNAVEITLTRSLK